MLSVHLRRVYDEETVAYDFPPNSDVSPWESYGTRRQDYRLDTRTLVRHFLLVCSCCDRTAVTILCGPLHVGQGDSTHTIVSPLTSQAARRMAMSHLRYRQFYQNVWIPKHACTNWPPKHIHTHTLQPPTYHPPPYHPPPITPHLSLSHSTRTSSTRNSNNLNSRTTSPMGNSNMGNDLPQDPTTTLIPSCPLGDKLHKLPFLFPNTHYCRTPSYLCRRVEVIITIASILNKLYTNFVCM